MSPKSIAATSSLVLETLPSGECAWLRSRDATEPEDAFYVLTDKGRDYLARLDAERAALGEEVS